MLIQFWIDLIIWWRDLLIWWFHNLLDSRFGLMMSWWVVLMWSDVLMWSYDLMMMKNWWQDLMMCLRSIKSLMCIKFVVIMKKVCYEKKMWSKFMMCWVDLIWWCDHDVLWCDQKVYDKKFYCYDEKKF